MIDARGEGRGLFAVGAAVEAVGAELAFGQADGLAYGVETVELECIYTDGFANGLHKSGILLGGFVHVGFQVAEFAAFELGDDTAGDEFEVVFGGGEVEVVATEEERGTADADMDAFHTVGIEHLCLVAELGAADDAVVAEYHAFAFEHFAGGDEFHFGHKAAGSLVDGHEAAGPCGGVFQDAAFVGDAPSGGVAQSHADTRVGDAGDVVGFDIVDASHGLAKAVAYFLGVDVFVFHSGEAIVNPEEGAYLHFVVGLDELLDAVRGNHHGFAGFDEIFGLEAEVDIAVAFGGDGIVVALTAHNEGGAAEEVAGGDDAVVGEDEEGDAATDVFKHIADAVGKGVALGYEEGDKLGGIGLAHAEFGELLVFGETDLFQLWNVVDSGHGAHCKTSEVRVAHDGLGVGVADNANALIAQHFVDVGVEFGFELGVLNVVDVEMNHTVVDGAETGPTGSEMRMIIGAIKKVGSTGCAFYYSKNSAHD